MLFVKDAEFAARLQHSSDIEELMEGFNDRPVPALKVAVTSESIDAASSAAVNDAAVGQTDRHDRLVLAPKPSYRRAA